MHVRRGNFSSKPVAVDAILAMVVFLLLSFLRGAFRFAVFFAVLAGIFFATDFFRAGALRAAVFLATFFFAVFFLVDLRAD